MVNIKDVAKVSGYSVGTVSKALNDYPDISEQTKQKIKDIATNLGYTPNSFGQSLVTKRSYTIGIVFEENTGFGLAHPFFGELLTVIKEEVEKHGYDLLLLSKHVGPYVNSYYEHCVQKGVDGVIVLSANLDNHNYEKLVTSDTPMVLIDLESDSKNTIYTDNYLSTRKAVKYLIDKGHKKIAYVKGDLYRYIGKERYNGFIDEMKANNIQVEEKYLFNAPRYTTEEGYSVAGEISLLSDLPTAVVCPADIVAIGVIDGLSNLKIKVPEQISVIGFDDIKLSSFITPKLTTIAQDKRQIGSLAVKTLIDNINNDKLEIKHYKIEGILVERNSVKEL